MERLVSEMERVRPAMPPPTMARLNGLLVAILKNSYHAPLQLNEGERNKRFGDLKRMCYGGCWMVLTNREM